jgi:predicted AlkP superfamily phosphohydrolase/phosphomutase
MMPPSDRLSRRTFLQIAGTTGLASVMCYFGGCSAGGGRRSTAGGKKVIVVGIDGFDPVLAEKLMDRGKLPTMARLRAAGGYSRLGTSIPPQSPVAWANFITGADAGTHGIYDFIHRDPKEQGKPVFSGSEAVGNIEGWEVGEHKLPLTFWPFNHSTTHTMLKREGTPFWDYLDEKGVPSWFYDIPANYPPSESKHGNHCCLAGMGTPDLLGSYGTYQQFSSRARYVKRDGTGMVKPLVFKNDAATGVLTGPVNTLLKYPKDTEAEFEVYRHPTDATARVELQGQTVVLKQGEWSDWCKVSFPLEMPSFLPNESAGGICRFYLQEVRPHFRLYVSPLNIDPSDPGEQKISEPTDFVSRISDDLGLFYTTGFQEDYNALRARVFTDEEYRVQADYVLQERMNLLNYALQHYDDGLLFFYFSSTDLQAHMFWWDSEEPHPTRSPEDAKKYMGVLEGVYARMDGVLADLIERYPDATIMCLSDHGFGNFRRQFGLNTWLRDNGYIDPPGSTSLFASHAGRGRPVDWSKTRAYAVGLNGLYLNLKGRERDGIVDSSEKDALLDEISAKLLELRDPENGERVISAVYRSDKVYSGPLVDRAPDLIIGYKRGYRSSWNTALGHMESELLSDNLEAWSADHCMATEELPGVVFANRAIGHENPSLIDMAPTILSEFGVRVPEHMRGRSILKA